MWAQVAQAVGSVAGGLIGAKAQQKANRQNIKLQKEFAQTGIRWKVEDAKKAGIHPLYALGANTHSFSPVSVGDGGASHFAQAGQDIGRAIHATRTGGEKLDAYTAASQKLGLQRQELENALLASQLAKINQPGTPPARPTLDQAHLIDGQGNSGLIRDTAMKRINANPDNPSQEPGSIVDVGFSRNPQGHFPMPSADVKQKIEDNPYQELMHFVRNNVLPMFGPSQHNPPYKAPYGRYWLYHPVYGYQLHKYSNYGPQKYHPARGAGKFAERRLTHW